MAEVNGTASPQLNRSQNSPPPSSMNNTASNATNTQNTQTSTEPASQTSTAQPAAASAIPTTSLSDPGTTARPRDARTIHLLLSSLGVAAYQDRVPLQLLDFAYRYTSSLLSDAQHLAAEGYVSSGGGTGASKGATAAAAAAAANSGAGTGEISLAAVRLAASSRLGYQFSTQGAGGGAGALPKETLLELAQERNKYKLPAVHKDEVQFGVRLPPERYCLTGGAWRMLSEWDGMEEVEENGEQAGDDVEMGEGGEGDEFEKYAGEREGDEEEDEDLAMGDD